MTMTEKINLLFECANWDNGDEISLDELTLTMESAFTGDNQSLYYCCYCCKFSL